MENSLLRGAPHFKTNKVSNLVEKSAAHLNSYGNLPYLGAWVNSFNGFSSATD
jgi:hypothetical protein